MVASIEALAGTFHIASWLNEITLHTHGADFSVFTGIAAGGLVYALLAGPGIRREAARQDEILEVR